MKRLRTTISVEKELWQNYKRFCKELGYVISYRLEHFMKSDILGFLESRRIKQ